VSEVRFFFVDNVGHNLLSPYMEESGVVL